MVNGVAREEEGRGDRRAGKKKKKEKKMVGPIGRKTKLFGFAS